MRKNDTNFMQLNCRLRSYSARAVTGRRGSESRHPSHPSHHHGFKLFSTHHDFSSQPPPAHSPYIEFIQDGPFSRMATVWAFTQNRCCKLNVSADVAVIWPVRVTTARRKSRLNSSTVPRSWHCTRDRVQFSPAEMPQ